LPDGDGEQFIEHVRRNGLPIKVIVASAAAEERRKACHPLGVPLIEKPIKPGKFDYLLKVV